MDLDQDAPREDADHVPVGAHLDPGADQSSGAEYRPGPLRCDGRGGPWRCRWAGRNAGPVRARDIGDVAFDPGFLLGVADPVGSIRTLTVTLCLPAMNPAKRVRSSRLGGRSTLPLISSESAVAWAACPPRVYQAVLPRRGLATGIAMMISAPDGAGGSVRRPLREGSAANGVANVGTGTRPSPKVTPRSAGDHVQFRRVGGTRPWAPIRVRAARFFAGLPGEPRGLSLMLTAWVELRLSRALSRMM